ncbi:leucine zipper domain-containing protein [Umezawaea sp.]|uniref:leucine zipper domain-containing protein n=1 Tax=Umezawaea sp. TaxID=1955258 RepID=UPI0039C9937C
MDVPDAPDPHRGPRPHGIARTTVHARGLVVTRHAAGWASARIAEQLGISRIAEQLGISRTTVHKWLTRHRHEGDAGLLDRTSRPHHSPRHTTPEVEQRIPTTRRPIRGGPPHLAGLLGLPASSLGRALRRHAVPALAVTDPITGTPLRRRHTDIRCERPHPATCCTSTSGKWAGYPPAAAGACTAAGKRCVAGASATTTRTSRWTTGPAWPTSMPCPTNRT